MPQNKSLLLLALLGISVLLLVYSNGHVEVMAGGKIYGKVYWVDQYGNLRPLAWAQVTAEGDGYSQTVYTTDGSYILFVPEGVYRVTASSEPGFYPSTVENVVVPLGGATALDFYLEPTGIPIPEFPRVPVEALFMAAALAALGLSSANRPGVRHRKSRSV